ncbi:MAG: hypothetical protein ACREN1_09070 [Candidatus Dormibacteria bacterium]
MTDADGGSRSLAERVETEIRGDVSADENLAKQIIADLVDKVESLEKRIASLERGS